MILANYFDGFCRIFYPRRDKLRVDKKAPRQTPMGREKTTAQNTFLSSVSPVGYESGRGFSEMLRKFQKAICLSIKKEDNVLLFYGNIRSTRRYSSIAPRLKGIHRRKKGTHT